MATKKSNLDERKITELLAMPGVDEVELPAPFPRDLARAADFGIDANKNKGGYPKAPAVLCLGGKKFS